MRKPSHLRYAALAGVLCLGPASFSQSAMAAEVVGGADGVTVLYASQEVTSMVLSGPDGLTASSDSATLIDDQLLPDGDYSVALYGELSEEQMHYSEVKQNMDQGRGANSEPENVPIGVFETISFRITDGNVESTSLAEE